MLLFMARPLKQRDDRLRTCVTRSQGASLRRGLLRTARIASNCTVRRREFTRRLRVTSLRLKIHNLLRNILVTNVCYVSSDEASLSLSLSFLIFEAIIYIFTVLFYYTGSIVFTLHQYKRVGLTNRRSPAIKEIV